MDGPGRPTLYRPEFAEQAYGLCLLGVTSQELADHFGVARSTIDKWRQGQPAFAQALKRGRRIADAAVAARLHARALGYSYETTRIELSRGKPVPVTHTVHCPPDVQACLFWLRNRRTPRRLRPSRASRGSTPDAARLVPSSRRQTALFGLYGARKVDCTP